uniref:Cell division cycle associated 5 n=2 Tax=Latimeria chalumnae TaxID=7897 RepID=H3ABA7_LATCH
PAKKVRRSYSRLEMALHRGSLGLSRSFSPTGESDTSTPACPKSSRRSFFGFESLLAHDVLLDVSPVKLNAAAAVPPLTTTSVEPDLEIPGVVLVKEKRKKRRIPQIQKSQLDEWAAQMNAEFDEAEKFDLLVE